MERTSSGNVARWGRVMAMLAAPPLLALAEMIAPIDHERDSAREILATLGESNGRYQLSVLLLLGGMALMIPAMLGLRQITSGRGHRAIWLGSLFLSIGLVMFCANVGSMGLAFTAMAELPAEQREAVTPAITAILDGRGAIIFTVFPLFLGLTVGSILMTIGLWRSRVLPLWSSLACAGGWWVFLLGPSHELRALGAAILLASLGPAAWRLMTANRPPILDGASPAVVWPVNESAP